MRGPRLVLVRHALPVSDPSAHPVDWVLDERAREDCVLLAHALRDLEQPFIRTSPEPKARQTADILGMRLGAWPEDDAGFGEVRRPAACADDHVARVTTYLSGEPLPGWERSSDALSRFGAAIARARASAAGRDVIVVSHGVVLTLYVEALRRGDPVAFWQSLPLPCAFEADLAHDGIARLFPAEFASWG